MSNRASYQRHNPNMSTRQTVKEKQAVLVFKDSDGNSALSALSERHIRRLARLFPQENPVQIVISLINGKVYHLPAIDQKIFLSFK